MPVSNRISVPGCTATHVERLPPVHGLQALKVTVEPGGGIPLHSHGCAATMFVTHGSARKLLAGGRGELVGPGAVVAKTAHEPHGFSEVGPEGFEFISLSDGAGIVHSSGMDMQYAAA